MNAHADALRRYPLFALLGQCRLEAWAASGQELPIATGDTLLQAGTSGLWAYLLVQGRVRVLRTGEGGREVSLGIYHPNSLFGDYALLPPYVNTATCRAASFGRVLRLPLLPLRHALAQLLAVERNLKNWLRLHALLAHLRDEPFLGFLSGPSAVCLLDHCQPMTFYAGCTVQADGLSADRWFFIESGHVALEGQNEPRHLGPGDCFGERALLDGRHLATAVALAEVRCQSLRRADFDPARQGPPSQQSACLLPTRGGQFPWVGQQEAADCGPAALAMIALCHGLHVTPARLRSLVGTRPDGATLLELRRAADALGLPCRAIRIGIAQLTEVTLPALAHLSDGHYVVLYGIGPEGAVIGDPASGVVRVALALLQRSCSGHLLLFSPPR